jgi:hypothetical protein
LVIVLEPSFGHDVTGSLLVHVISDNEHSSTESRSLRAVFAFKEYAVAALQFLSVIRSTDLAMGQFFVEMLSTQELLASLLV